LIYNIEFVLILYIINYVILVDLSLPTLSTHICGINVWVIEFGGCDSLFVECEKWFLGLSIACCKFFLRLYCKRMREMQLWPQQQLHVS